jgi:uncharacterized membrane protein
VSAAATERRAPSYARGTDEFTRVVAFSDGVFAIAMTLLVVGIGVPAVSDSGSVGQLADALNDTSESFISFFISFAVIGRYWVAHHRFFSLLERMDVRFIAINLIFLALIAFLPFPTDLLGTYFDNPLSVAIYAVAVGLVSGLEVVMFSHAHRNDLLRRRLPEDVYRWGRFASLSPVLFFAASIPVAFVSTTAAVAVWFLSIPFGLLADRRKPRKADELLSGM